MWSFLIWFVLIGLFLTVFRGAIFTTSDKSSSSFSWLYTIFSVFSFGGDKDVPQGGTFESFLRNADTTAAKKEIKPEFLVDDPNPGKLVLVLYGTEYGASKEVAQKLDSKLKDAGFCKPRVINMADYKAIDLDKEQAVVVVCSTAGDGIPPTEARPFYDFINSDSAQLPLGLPFSVCALGDSNYPHFCRCGRTFDTRMAELGSTRFYQRVDVDQEDWGVINAWIDGVTEALRNVQLQVLPEYLAGQVVGESADKTAQSGTSYTRSRPYFAPVAVKRSLTIVTSPGDQECIHVELDLTDSGISYVPGDALAVLPSNNPSHVQAILDLNDWSPDTMINAPSWHYGEKGAQITLKEALLKCYDLKQVRPELLKVVSEELTKVGHPDAERVQSLLADGMSRSNIPLHSYLENREVVDVLSDFPAAKIPLSSLFPVLRQLLPRYYSISSSPLVDSNRVSITVAIVRYETLGKQRQGVTTTFLADRVQVGDSIPIFINSNTEFRLPASPSTPILMIGPGTGLAPFRAFVQHRALTQETAIPESNVLFFGCRYSARDFLYKDELQAYVGDSRLTLHTAFSRDQANKIYVQHRLLESAASIWQLIQAGGHVYICGDAKYMARDVHAALLEIATTHGSLATLNDAKAFFESLEKEHRYQKDVWA
mmetsp:Transcript_42372/g.70567  ORF Transcript_42372/g.70567 Transcript_42372/m.70567 type:complete len:655 (-) Transcript_42372:473-2437(-)|eukprot:CAMPEP_0184340420 /NCGR_PEP_ID=MMETSP1089-20130417/9099_1 /TAXON_ID=38269 ORGANISM="Gloeochaete wittrockiana, Strain SAG46.84" /NCGR_SAMPLE_ID=MMETSP1089 /ASSEMBLY_ACC=CAM_ASM_000445 /LENGTH=654 /DNA_ID=CAMNT_0026668227 /DNA_START=76 /DNA_END=2040 /DNA_ORIENTATION=-